MYEREQLLFSNNVQCLSIANIIFISENACYQIKIQEIHMAEIKAMVWSWSCIYIYNTFRSVLNICQMHYFIGWDCWTQLVYLRFIFGTSDEAQAIKDFLLDQLFIFLQLKKQTK